MIRGLRYRFWLWVHDALEKAWHWVYFNKMRTVEHHIKHVAPPWKYSKVFEDGEATFWISGTKK
jgi:hypothetical protein